MNSNNISVDEVYVFPGKLLRNIRGYIKNLQVYKATYTLRVNNSHSLMILTLLK